MKDKKEPQPQRKKSKSKPKVDLMKGYERFACDAPLGHPGLQGFRGSKK